MSDADVFHEIAYILQTVHMGAHGFHGKGKLDKKSRVCRYFVIE
jgi:hypothetical protein